MNENMSEIREAPLGDQTCGVGRWLLIALVAELALIYFFVAAGRFRFSLAGIGISIGYDAYKLWPFSLHHMVDMAENESRKTASPIAPFFAVDGLFSGLVDRVDFLDGDVSGVK